MHGVDWAKQKAEVRGVPAARRDARRPEPRAAVDVERAAVGHHSVGGGDTLAEPRTVPGGLLGADYEVANGRYRLKKVYGGLNWNPQLRAPLTEPGVNAKAGEYLLAVNGTRPASADQHLQPVREHVGQDRRDHARAERRRHRARARCRWCRSRTKRALRNRDWVEGNLKKVDKATGGRVAYVYVPNTGGAGHTYFKRYFYPQVHKDAVIVDERFNGGGRSPTTTSTSCAVRSSRNWAMRYGADLKTPFASIQGPKAMIIDETAGSGGDLLPWMFRKFKMGPLVGKRTWGGLVGILGFPVLMDGGTITAPNLAIWTPEDGWVVENEGVPPDIEVEQTPADVIAGRDPQLEKAIEVVMAELKKNPPAKTARPAVSGHAARRSAAPFRMVADEDGVRTARPGSPLRRARFAPQPRISDDDGADAGGRRRRCSRSRSRSSTPTSCAPTRSAIRSSFTRSAGARETAAARASAGATTRSCATAPTCSNRPSPRARGSSRPMAVHWLPRSSRTTTSRRSVLQSSWAAPGVQTSVAWKGWCSAIRDGCDSSSTIGSRPSHASWISTDGCFP